MMLETHTYTLPNHIRLTFYGTARVKLRNGRDAGETRARRGRDAGETRARRGRELSQILTEEAY